MQQSVVVSDTFGSRNLPIIVSTQCHRQANTDHLHRHFQICYIFSGNMIHQINDKAHMQSSGDCSIIFPYTPHKVDFTMSEDTPVAVFISFHSDFLRDRKYNLFPLNHSMARFNDKLLLNTRTFSGDSKEQADFYMREIMAEFSKQHDMSFDKIASLLADFLQLMCVDSPASQHTVFTESHIDAINKAIAYIEKNYSKKLTIEELCTIATMSRCMFTKHFKAITGMTFAQFLLALRLERVSGILLNTELSLNEIAKLTGLNDKTHLAHMFSKHFGISPMKYKEQMLPDAILSHNVYKKRWEWLKEKETT